MLASGRRLGEPSLCAVSPRTPQWSTQRVRSESEVPRALTAIAGQLGWHQVCKAGILSDTNGDGTCPDRT